MRSSVAVLLFLGSSAVCAADRDPDLGIGRDATQAEIAAWDSDVRPDGSGLPDGRGSVEQGEAVFRQSCSACHTTTSRAALAPALVGGVGSLATAKPLQTVGSYWPYATTLFDYVRRAMPFNAPHSLTNDQVYTVSAYILHLNGIVPADAIMDQHSLPQIRMPNRDGFHSVWHDAP